MMVLIVERMPCQMNNFFFLVVHKRTRTTTQRKKELIAKIVLNVSVVDPVTQWNFCTDKGIHNRAWNINLINLIKLCYTKINLHDFQINKNEKIVMDDRIEIFS